MIQIDLIKRQRARLWLDEEPYASTQDDQFVERVIKSAKPSLIKGPHIIAVELFVPLGGRFLYGLLGVRCRSIELDKELCVRVAVAPASQVSYVTPLFDSLDNLTCGLSIEYVESVFDGVQNVFNSSEGLPSGELNFQWAVCGVIGSNQLIFSHLAGLLAKAWKCQTCLSTNEVLLEVLKEDLPIYL